MITAAVLIFIAVFLVILAAFFVYASCMKSPKAHLQRRLRRLKADGDTTSRRVSNLLMESTGLEARVFELPLLNKLKRLIAFSGVAAKSSVVLATLIVSYGGMFWIIYFLRSHWTAAFIGATLAPLLVIGYLIYLKNQRERKFCEQLPDVLMMISRSLRAGHSLPSAVELVSQELPEPTQGLFRVVYEQQQLGMRIADALQTLLERIHCTDLHYFITVIRINSESGGNLSDILDKLAATITSRLQLRKQVQVLTAEGRISGYILILLPVIVFFVFNLRNPDYMKPFFTEHICKMVLLAAAFAQLLGYIVVRRIINIRI